MTSFSATTVSCFALAQGRKEFVAHASGSHTSYAFYSTLLQCSSRDCVPVTIWIYLLCDGVIFSDDTVIFLAAKTAIVKPTLAADMLCQLDAFIVHVFGGSPADPAYQEVIPEWTICWFTSWVKFSFRAKVMHHLAVALSP
jgi:hypothetical protein